MNYIFYSLLLTCFMVGCSSKQAENETKEVSQKIRVHGDTIILNSVQMKNGDIVVARPGEENMKETITVNGLVDVPPQSLVSISAPMGGYLKHTTLLPGAKISKGQVIAILEDPSYVQLQEDYLIAKARMQYATAELQRQKDLQHSNATSTKSYQLAQSEYNVLQVQINSLAEKLRVIHINPSTLTSKNITRRVNMYAPINGFVAKVNANIGKYVSPSDVLFELVNPSDIHASITVFEKDLMNFKPGMRGVVSLNNDPDKKYPVEVLLVSKNLNEDRSALVHCHFVNEDHSLLPGMFLKATFDIKNYQSKAIPENAVVHFEGNDYVFVAANDTTFVMNRVNVAGSFNGFVTLQSDSLLSRRIVTKGAFNLLGAMKGGEE